VVGQTERAGRIASRAPEWTLETRFERPEGFELEPTGVPVRSGSNPSCTRIKAPSALPLGAQHVGIFTSSSLARGTDRA